MAQRPAMRAVRRPPAVLNSSRARERSTAGALALCAFSISLLVACGRVDEGKALAKAGVDASDTLARHYDSLIQDTLDTWEFEAFLSSLRGVPFSDREENLLQARYDALAGRARLARSLKTTYAALLSLSEYDASGEVGKAAEELAGSMTELAQLEDGPDPAGILGMVAADLVAWKQTGDLKEGSKLILVVLERLKTLIAAEEHVYASITQERGNKVEAITEHLISKEMVAALPLLERVPKLLELPLIDDDKPVGDPATKTALVQMARVRVRRAALISSGASTQVQHALEELAANHIEFNAGKGMTLDRVAASLERAQAYMDELQKLRAAEPATEQ